MISWLYERMIKGLGGTQPRMSAPLPPRNATTPTDRLKELSERFTYHAPTEKQIKKYGSLRTRAKEFAFLIEDLCPDSPEKESALTALDQVVMFSNAAIARHGDQT